MEIFELTNTLGKKLAESAEYKRLVNAQNAQMSEKSAQDLIVNYNFKRNEIATKIRNGGITEEQMGELRNDLDTAFETLLLNPFIKEYIDAQKAFESVYGEVMDILNSYVGNSNAKSSGGCSSCSGCK